MPSITDAVHADRRFETAYICPRFMRTRWTRPYRRSQGTLGGNSGVSSIVQRSAWNSLNNARVRNRDTERQIAVFATMDLGYTVALGYGGVAPPLSL